MADHIRGQVVAVVIILLARVAIANLARILVLIVVQL